MTIQTMYSHYTRLVEASMRFDEFKSHGGTSKMWIDPKGRPIALDGMHYEWLRDNAPFIRKAYKLPDMPEFGVRDEGPARLWALSSGFTRVNYRNGTVTFETDERFWDRRRRDTVSALIDKNADLIDLIVVNVLDDGKLVRDGSADVHGLDEVAAKVQAIPVIPALETAMLAELIRRNRVEASSLTRVLRAIGRDDPQANDIDVTHPFAILTAYDSAASSETNSRRLEQMRQQLGRAGLKLFMLSGHWSEPPDGVSFEEAAEEQKLVMIEEKSVFCVPKPDVDFSTFEAVITRQAARFNQVAVIMSDGANVWVRYSDGHQKQLGDRVDIDSLQTAYQQMRDQHEHPFVFE